MTEQTYRHWQLDIDNNHVAWLQFDHADTDTNVLSSDALNELDDLIQSLPDEHPSRLVISSAKKNGFCAGANVEEFTRIEDYQQAYDYIRSVQKIFDRIENLSFPTVCVIHGFCLGGGLELALACDFRIAEESASTRIGLPEVKLGIHPGYAGSARLTHLIGAPAAMNMILSGRTVSGSQAHKIGIVSLALPERLLKSGTKQFIHQLPTERPRARGWRALTNSWIGRQFLSPVFTAALMKTANLEHYPAPYAQIEIWRKHGGSPASMTLAEADSVARLINTPAAKNLIRLFFLQNRLKSLGKSSSRTISHVHVIGAGVMGGDIAAWCALKGLRVTLQDKECSMIAPAIRRAHKLFRKKIKSWREVQHAHDRIIADPGGNGIAGADIIIEAIIEDLNAKQTLFQDIEARAKSDAILATNTSSLKLEHIAEAMQQPERLVGVHFFNPVAKMMLIEIVKGSATAAHIVNEACTFTRQISKLPLPVASSPGFLINRILMPYLLEAVIAYDEGIPGPAIDQAAKHFGMPMGPIELADTVGLDVCLHVAKILANDLGYEVPSSLNERVAAGKLGKKTGEGFYRYCEKGKCHTQPMQDTGLSEELEHRLIYRLINEAVQCLHEGVVEEPDLLDAGVVFGTGFAPFHGGPMQFSATTGSEKILQRLNELSDKYGDRYQPSPGW